MTITIIPSSSTELKPTTSPNSELLQTQLLFELFKEAISKMKTNQSNNTLIQIRELEPIFTDCKNISPLFISMDPYFYKTVKLQARENTEIARKILNSMPGAKENCPEMQKRPRTQKPLLYWRGMIRILCQEKDNPDEIDPLVRVNSLYKAYYKIFIRLLLAEKALKNNEMEKAIECVLKAENICRETKFSPRLKKLKIYGLLKIAAVKSKIPDLKFQVDEDIKEALRLFPREEPVSSANFNWSTSNPDWSIHKKAVKILASFNENEAKKIIERLPDEMKEQFLIEILMKNGKRKSEDAYETLSLFENPYHRALLICKILLLNSHFDVEKLIESFEKQPSSRKEEIIDSSHSNLFPLKNLNEKIQSGPFFEDISKLIQKISNVILSLPQSRGRSDLERFIIFYLTKHLTKKHLIEAHKEN